MRLPAMTHALGTRVGSLRARLKDGWQNRALALKAIAFAFVGVINTAIDYSVFLLAQTALSRSAAALSLFGAVAASCGCGNTTTVRLVAANMISWTVAVTGSYILNSSITFAHESGRKLRWRSYLTFIAVGVIGWIANTATLVFAAQALLLPIWAAKAVAVLASFVVNFSLAHFVVFRRRVEPAMRDGA